MQMPGKIILVSKANTRRLEYVAGFLSGVLGISVDIIPSDQLEWDPQTLDWAIVHYGPEPVEGAFNIFSSGLLFETGIKKPDTGVFRDQDLTFLFPAPGGFSLHFDIFSAIFFLISRYEEYLPFQPDHFGRFEADQSLSYKHGFLEDPVVDLWIEIFRDKIKERYPNLEFHEQEFRYISTFDIDNPWAYKYKGLARITGGILKSLLHSDMEDLHTRLDVLRGKKQDPFDTYAYIKSMELKYDFRSLFFFLTGNYGGYDTNYALNTWHFKELMHDLSFGRPIGIHPSFKSHFNYNLLAAEYKRFSNILGNKPEMSRQHFLMIGFPETYRQLIPLGIKQEYSMGYASQPGFRAGTSNPFRFYDLEQESETKLMIHPFSIMDVTLMQYLLLTPDESIAWILKIIGKVYKVKGQFISLWHNESLSDSGVWKGWKRVFEGMVEEVRRRK